MDRNLSNIGQGIASDSTCDGHSMVLLISPTKEMHSRQRHGVRRRRVPRDARELQRHLKAHYSKEPASKRSVRKSSPTYG